MRRKFWAVVFVIVMALSLVACGKKQSESTNIVPQASGESEENTKQSGIEVSNGGVTVVPGKVEEVSTEATISETVLYDKDSVKITATSLSYNEYQVELNLLIENNSHKDVEIISGSVGYCCNSINGYMVNSGYLHEEVAVGKKAKDSMRFDISELKMLGITRIADICVGFDIQDPNNKSTYVEPVKIETSVASGYDYSVNTYRKAIRSGALSTVYEYQLNYFAENELYNHNDVAIVSQAMATNADGDKALLVELINNSSQRVCATVGNIYINGLAVQGGNWDSEFINSGARCVMQINLDSAFDKEYWSKFGISEVGEVIFSLTLKDSDYKEIVGKKEVTVTISDANVSLDTSGVEVYNSNGIRILSKGIVDKSSDYLKDINLLFMVINDTSVTIEPDVVYDSLSLNGYMVDEWTIGLDVLPGKCGVMEVEPTWSSLEKNGVNKVSDITEAEMTIEIRDDKYNKIAETNVKVKY